MYLNANVDEFAAVRGVDVESPDEGHCFYSISSVDERTVKWLASHSKRPGWDSCIYIEHVAFYN